MLHSPLFMAHFKDYFNVNKPAKTRKPSDFFQRVEKAILNQAANAPLQTSKEQYPISTLIGSAATAGYITAAALAALIPTQILGREQKDSLAKMVFTAGVVKNCILSVFVKSADRNTINEWNMAPVVDKIDLYTYHAVVILATNMLASCLEKEAAISLRVLAIFIAHFPPLQKTVIASEKFKVLSDQVRLLINRIKEQTTFHLDQAMKSEQANRLFIRALQSFPSMSHLKMMNFIEEVPVEFSPVCTDWIDYNLKSLTRKIPHALVEGTSYLSLKFVENYLLSRAALAMIATYPVFGVIGLIFAGGKKQTLQDVGFKIAGIAVLVLTKSPLAATLCVYARSLSAYIIEINRRCHLPPKVVVESKSDEDEEEKDQNLPQEVGKITQTAISAAIVLAPLFPLMNCVREDPLLEMTIVPGIKTHDLGLFFKPNSRSVYDFRNRIVQTHFDDITYQAVVLLSASGISAVVDKQYAKGVRIVALFATQVPWFQQLALETKPMQLLTQGISEQFESVRENAVSIAHPFVMQRVVAHAPTLLKFAQRIGAFRDLTQMLSNMQDTVQQVNDCVSEKSSLVLAPLSNAIVDYHTDLLAEGAADMIVITNKKFVGGVVNFATGSALRTAQYYLFYKTMFTIFEAYPLIGVASFVLAGGQNQTRPEMAVRACGVAVLYSTNSPLKAALFVRVALTVNYIFTINQWNKPRAMERKAKLLGLPSVPNTEQQPELVLQNNE